MVWRGAPDLSSVAAAGGAAAVKSAAAVVAPRICRNPGKAAEKPALRPVCARLQAAPAM